MTAAFYGSGVHTAQRIAIGPAYVLEPEHREIGPRTIEPSALDAEIARLTDALQAARHALEAVRNRVPRGARDVVEVIDAHLMMLADRTTLVEPTCELIRSHRWGAEWALQQHRNTLIDALEAVEDPYLRARQDDVHQVVDHILGFLLGAPVGNEAGRADLDGCIVIARDLAPAEVVVLHYRGASAFATEFGGTMSHTGVLARGLDMPAVVGARSITRYLQHDETVVVDDESGVVLATTDEGLLAHYRRELQALERRRQSLKGLVRAPAESTDGVAVNLFANLELPEDIEAARDNGASGVGLYRTEFLYMNRKDIPREEEQLENYLSVLRGLGGIPVTIRTLDLGADKQFDGGIATQSARNPALGLRAIRWCLKDPALLRPQLRAIMRASAEGPVRMMIPMLSNLPELRAVLRLIHQTRDELVRDGIAFDPNMPIGGMIEVPSAALSAVSFARHLDFMCIGTNDLIQYTLAIDRTDDSVSHLYDPLHPAILRLIHTTLAAGRQTNKPVGMCGEMAGEARFTRLLLGLGLREFSMQPGFLLDVKETVRASDVAHLSREIERLINRLDEDEPEQIAESIERLNAS